MPPKTPTGIRVRHSRTCAATEGCRCNCSPSFEASVWSARDNRQIRKSFRRISEARSWRTDAAHGVSRGTLRAPSALTLREAATAWLNAAEAGEVLSRNRHPYKPSTLRTYRHDLETYVLHDLGARKLSDLRADDLQALVDRLMASGLSGSKVRNVVVALQALYRRHRHTVALDPTDGLDLPEPGGRRERVATPQEAARLLEALPEGERALWACAFYAGLRRGELRALRADDIDLAENVIRVSRSWDDKAGAVEPKSVKGRRQVPVPAILRKFLLEHRARTGRRGDDLVFGRTASEPFTPTFVRAKARKAWEAAGLEPIGLHECRHTYVSLMHTAGVPLERVGDYAGHSSAYMTDRYRHLIEGQRETDAGALDSLLSNAHSNAHPAQRAS